MAKNLSLNAAGAAKQDEFYTQYQDIQNELNHYEKHFEGKTVFCNCDDPFESNFCRFFLRNFNHLKLKRLICTSYSSSPFRGKQLSLFDDADAPLEFGNGYVMDVTSVPMANGRGVSDDDIEHLLKSKKRGVKKLKGDGDFRSDECIEYLKQADIVVTNPPFSLFREYVSQLMEYEKQFLIIGNQNNVTYKEIFPLIQQNRIWLGWKFGDMAFRVPDSYEPRATRFWIDDDGQKWRSFGTICWYTNLDHDKRHEPLILYRHYYGNEAEYPKYDNYDAINVNKVSEIPCDYFENMAVLITNVDKHNPDQFEIVDANDIRTNENTPQKSHGLIKDKDAAITEKALTAEANDEYALTDRQTDRQTDTHYLCSNCHPQEDVAELWEYQSHSLTSTTQMSLKSSDLPQAISGDLQEYLHQRERTDRISEESSSTAEFSSSVKCNGIMGVPITFLDKYNPNQFEIIGLDRYVEDNPHYGHRFTINGKETYARILIRRLQNAN